MATITAIVPAAGQGARAGLSGNKVFADLAGAPLLVWTLRALLDLPADCDLEEILIAARPDEWEEIRQILASEARLCEVRLVKGGENRQESVGNAAQVARGEWILVHDAARPCISPIVIENVWRAAQKTGAALAALPVSDTVKQSAIHSNLVDQTLDRATVFLAQTPQIFRRELFLEALENAKNENFVGTDCASLIEKLGRKVALARGEAENFKVTFPADFERAAQWLGFSS